VGRHPFGTLQVAFPDGPRPLGFLFGVHAQDDPRRLCPICTLGAGIEEPQICDQVVLVVIVALRMCLMARRSAAGVGLALFLLINYF
jgi:hypothetical protein